MSNFLSKLYNGELDPAGGYFPRIEEHRRLKQAHLEHYEQFTRKLNEIDPALGNEFYRIMDEQLDFAPMEVSEMFIDGFCMGAKMMAEVYERMADRSE